MKLELLRVRKGGAQMHNKEGRNRGHLRSKAGRRGGSSVMVVMVPKEISPPASDQKPVAQLDQNAVIKNQRGKTCILSIDGGGMREILSGKALAYFEKALKLKLGNLSLYYFQALKVSLFLPLMVAFPHLFSSFVLYFLLVIIGILPY